MCPNCITHNTHIKINRQPQDHTRVHILGTRIFDSIHVPPPAAGAGGSRVRFCVLWLCVNGEGIGVRVGDIQKCTYSRMERTLRWSCPCAAALSRSPRPCTGTRSVSEIFSFTHGYTRIHTYINAPSRPKICIQPNTYIHILTHPYNHAPQNHK